MQHETFLWLREFILKTKAQNKHFTCFILYLSLNNKIFFWIKFGIERIISFRKVGEKFPIQQGSHLFNQL